MNRRIVLPNQQVQDVDILATNQNTMTALGRLVELVMGTATAFGGFACTPTTVASMSVNIGPGSVYSLQNLESTAYGSLAADTAHQVMKQGINPDTTTLTLAAPTTTGYSVVYLIQGAYAESDTGSTTIPFRDSVTQVVTQQTVNTSRTAVCALNAKAGTAATTGTQVAPAPDAGYTGLYTVTVANGQTTITSGNIATLASAPLITGKLPGKLNAASNLSDVANATTALANLGGPFIKTIKSKTFAASGTYTPSAGMLYCIVEIVGGGGGGGGSAANVTYGAAGGGGGAGGYARGIFSASAIGGSLAFTVGASGAAGASGSGNGGNGGATTFGSLTANGGTGGAAGAASTTTGRGGPGGNGGTSTGGDTNTPGSAGSAGLVLAGSALGGQGGASFFAGATQPVVENTAGMAGTASGGGGGGGASLGNASGGGQGASGYVRVTEFCST